MRLLTGCHMLERPPLREPSPSGAALATRPAWPWAVLACAGLIGAAGVGVGAAGAHSGGGDLTRIASDFLLIHASVLVGGGAVVLSVPRPSIVWACALFLLAIGVVLFGGELALAGLYEWRPLPLAAPAGGLCLIAGWLLLALAAGLTGLRRR